MRAPMVRPLEITNRNDRMSEKKLQKPMHFTTPSKQMLINEVGKPEPPKSEIDSDCSSQSIGVFQKDYEELEKNHNTTIKALSQNKLPSVLINVSVISETPLHQGV